MTKAILYFAAVAAFPLALNASALNNADRESASHQTKSHQNDGANTNPSIHDHCSCPADCPCRTEQHATCDCGCAECGSHHQHD